MMITMKIMMKTRSAWQFVASRRAAKSSLASGSPRVLASLHGIISQTSDHPDA